MGKMMRIHWNGSAIFSEKPPWSVFCQRPLKRGVLKLPLKFWVTVEPDNPSNMILLVIWNGYNIYISLDPHCIPIIYINIYIYNYIYISIWYPHDIPMISGSWTPISDSFWAQVIACHYDASSGELLPTDPVETVPGAGLEGQTEAAAIRISGGGSPGWWQFMGLNQVWILHVYIGWLVVSNIFYFP